ncbi:hypothetical protein [Nodularia spumigena]
MRLIINWFPALTATALMTLLVGCLSPTISREQRDFVRLVRSLKTIFKYI